MSTNIMTTLFGVGPIHINRTIGGEKFNLIYPYHKVLDIDVEIDSINSGLKNPSGESLEKYKGIYVHFKLVLPSAPVSAGGTGGNNHRLLFNLLSKIIQADRSDQYITIIPAYNDGEKTGYGCTTGLDCKFENKKIPIRDLCVFKGRGQSISLGLVTKTRDTDFSIPWSRDVEAGYTAITDHEGNAITDHEGNSLTGI